MQHASGAIFPWKPPLSKLITIDMIATGIWVSHCVFESARWAHRLSHCKQLRVCTACILLVAIALMVSGCFWGRWLCAWCPLTLSRGYARHRSHVWMQCTVCKVGWLHFACNTPYARCFACIAACNQSLANDDHHNFLILTMLIAMMKICGHAKLSPALKNNCERQASHQ